MKISIALLLITFLYSITIFIIYFSRTHLNNYETKIYKSLIISNLIFNDEWYDIVPNKGDALNTTL